MNFAEISPGMERYFSKNVCIAVFHASAATRLSAEIMRRFVCSLNLLPIFLMCMFFLLMFLFMHTKV